MVAEPAGQPQPVLADLGGLAGVTGDALGDGAEVAGGDARLLLVAEPGAPSGAGGGSGGVGVSITVTETIYRQQIRPVIEGRAGVMDRNFPYDADEPGAEP